MRNNLTEREARILMQVPCICLLCVNCPFSGPHLDCQILDTDKTLNMPPENLKRFFTEVYEKYGARFAYTTVDNCNVERIYDEDEYTIDEVIKLFRFIESPSRKIK